VAARLLGEAMMHKFGQSQGQGKEKKERGKGRRKRKSKVWLSPFFFVH
jgi:hypothetical protein